MERQRVETDLNAAIDNAHTLLRVQLPLTRIYSNSFSSEMHMCLTIFLNVPLHHDSLDGIFLICGRAYELYVFGDFISLLFMHL